MLSPAWERPTGRVTLGSGNKPPREDPVSQLLAHPSQKLRCRAVQRVSYSAASPSPRVQLPGGGASSVARTGPGTQ